jgi:mono/diheme cytochrome c family protein
MERKKVLFALSVVIAVLAGAWFAVSRASLSALEPPGRFETYVATKAKRWLVARAAASVGPPPTADEMAGMRGEMNYMARCRACHGADGRTPTDVGSSMYPPAPDLGSPAVQSYTDAELYVVIRDGVRLTGMPGFGRIHKEGEIWDLVRYVRSRKP